MPRVNYHQNYAIYVLITLKVSEKLNLKFKLRFGLRYESKVLVKIVQFKQSFTYAFFLDFLNFLKNNS